MLDKFIGGWQIAGLGSLRSNYFTLPTNNYPTGTPIQFYGYQYPIQDCRSGACFPGYLWWNGYIPANRINSVDANGKPNGVMGVPVTYSNKSITFKNDQVVSGIYCVTGDIKIQSRVTGKVVLLATGLITTSGGNENLETADPTGADVVMLAGSTDVKAISIQATDSVFKGVIVAAGGVYISSKNSTFDTGLLGTQVLVSGTNNLLKAPQ